MKTKSNIKIWQNKILFCKYRY